MAFFRDVVSKDLYTLQSKVFEMLTQFPTPQIHPSDLYTHMGRSLYSTQVLEHLLAYYLGIWAEVPPEEARKLVEDSLTKTLGALHNELRKRKLVPEGLEDRLSAYREERNWLVHRLYADSCEDQYSPSKAPKLVQRVTVIGEEANRLTKLFDQLNEQWMKQNGITPTDFSTSSTNISMKSPRRNNPS